jgi:hypothetical protein
LLSNQSINLPIQESYVLIENNNLLSFFFFLQKSTVFD